MKQVITFMAALTLLLSIQPVLANEATETETSNYSKELDKYYLRLGAFINLRSETTLAADTGYLLGAIIDTSQTLGQSADSVTPRIDGYWRYHPRHSLGFTIFSVNQNGNKVLEEDLRWDEEYLFGAGTNVDSYLDLDIFKIDYTYSFYRSEKVELGVSGGLHVTGVSAGISGEATVYDNDGNTIIDTRFVDESVSVTAPLPVVGIKLNYNFTPKARFMFKTDLFALEISDYRGVLQDTSLLFEYKPWKHVGFGAGINALNLDIEENYDQGDVSIENEIAGALVYVTLHY